MAWYDEAIFYHIYPLGLLDAPKENDYSEPVHRFRELKPWIKHIKEIGCNAIYIGPLFESAGHGYETTDYKKLDSRLGDNEDLKKFVKDCHSQGIRVIFDGVFNHVGRDFFAFKDLKQNRENSAYRDWFINVNFYGNNEYNDGFSYDNWGGYNLLVKLNQRNPAVKDYICDVIRYWVSEFDVDGIRLDAADVLDFDYMRALRGVANEVKPDFWLMGEVIHGDYSRWVNEGTLHSVTNYTLHKALFSGHNDHNYFEIAHTVKRLYDMGGNRPDGLRLYNFSDNHDVERIINKLNNRANYLPVHVLVYTLPGVPSIYYGSEFGIEGKKEKFSDASLRPALNYDNYKNAIEENPYTAIIAALGRARMASKALSYGAYREVTLTNRQYMFTRSTDDATAVVTVNNDEASATISGNGIRDGKYIGAISGNTVSVSNGYFTCEIAANSGEIWLEEKEAANLKCAFDFKKITSPKTEPKADNIKLDENETEILSDEDIKVAEVNTETGNPVQEKEQAVKLDSVLSEISKAAKEEKIESGELALAALKYSLDSKYSNIDPDEINSRYDYDNMSIEELQVAILEKMNGNGHVDNQMIKTVMDNVYLDSLRTWVKSFR